VAEERTPADTERAASPASDFECAGVWIPCVEFPQLEDVPFHAASRPLP
jgi:hypothetical protein